MNGDFKPIQLPAVNVAGLGEVKNITVTVPADTTVPFAIVKVDGAHKRRQTLRLDMDKGSFIDIPQNAKYRVAKGPLAERISTLVQSLRGVLARER